MHGDHRIKDFGISNRTGGAFWPNASLGNSNFNESIASVAGASKIKISSTTLPGTSDPLSPRPGSDQPSSNVAGFSSWPLASVSFTAGDSGSAGLSFQVWYSNI